MVDLKIKHLTNIAVNLRNFLFELNEIFVYGEICWLENFSCLWWSYDSMKLMMM